MIPGAVFREAEKSGIKYLYYKNTVQSVSPAESMFGYTVWSHMIPPFKPEHTLILGYGGGTVAELMRKIWGQSKITGVDIEARKDRYNEYKMKIMDAKEFLWDATKDKFYNGIPLFSQTKYDYVCIDLWDGDKVCDFIFDTEFVVRLKEIATDLVCLNVLNTDIPKLKSYYDYGFMFNRVVPIERNSVQWWSVYEQEKVKET